MNRAISKDGTPIAYERLGTGQPLILVDGALCSRSFGPMPRLAALLAEHFTVFFYDRRGRGESGDMQPYTKDREVEDIEALIKEAGGRAFVVGISSGAGLALEAAASGLGIKKLAVYEPPYLVDAGDTRTGVDHLGQLKRIIAAGKRGDAVKYFMREMVRVPAIFVALMQWMPGVWPKLKAAAHTLPYDVEIMCNFTMPVRRLAAITTPTLAINGGRTEAWMQRTVQAVAEVVPNVQHRTLQGQTHNVKPQALVPVLVEFFTA